MSSWLTANDTCSLVNPLFRRERRDRREEAAVQTLPPATTVHRAAAAASYDAERSRACRGPRPILTIHGPRHLHSLQQPPTARLLEVVTKATLLIIIITIRMASGTRLALFTQSRLARFNVCTRRTASVKPWDQYCTILVLYGIQYTPTIRYHRRV